MRLAFLAFLVPLAGCAVKGTTEEEKSIRMLLAAGADRNAKDSNNLTALDWARKAGCTGCQELLQ